MDDAPTSSPSTRRTLLDVATQQLRDAGREAPRRTATWLLMDVLDCSRTSLVVDPDAVVGPAAAERFERMVDRRVAGEPLQHVLGYDDFFGLRLSVSEDVLIPRPETEEVVEYALACLDDRNGSSPPRVLDVGTGSGCIALAIAHERPDADVHACDVSRAALDVARGNAERLDLDVTFRRADVLADDVVDAVGVSDVDLLVSNPPYIPDDEVDDLPAVVREYDPAVALFAGDDPLRFYRALALLAPRLCSPGGHLVVETHADFADGVETVFRDAGLRDVTVRRDLAGRPRIAHGVVGASTEASASSTTSEDAGGLAMEDGVEVGGGVRRRGVSSREEKNDG